ncbi:hypothetical protein [Polaribacter atrinae]|uniref:hypothetical protein n=1 Tax=Polaribacter atrinae TaxID=1333662 RepID=UPI002491D197|nr:hypothetical protein [Polaribacter atrinae]
MKNKTTSKDLVSRILAFLTIGITVFFILSLIVAGGREITNNIPKNYIILAIILSVFLALYIGYKASRFVNYENSLKKVVNSQLLPYALELILPVIFTSLFYILVDSKDLYDYDVEAEYIITLVGTLFFFTLFIEWLRRKKDKTDRPIFFQYLYIIVMFFAFIFSVWYLNQFE